MNNIVVNSYFNLIEKASLSLYKLNKTVTLVVFITKTRINPFKKLADTVKIRRHILMTLEAASPIGASDSLILSVISPAHPNATLAEIRGKLDCLADIGLVKVTHYPNGHWHCRLVEAGIVGGVL